ncbi:hypothetical protein ACIQMJ_28190 [Actinosynnema sp. NPDC091369]
MAHDPQARVVGHAVGVEVLALREDHQAVAHPPDGVVPLVVVRADEVRIAHYAPFAHADTTAAQPAQRLVRNVVMR